MSVDADDIGKEWRIQQMMGPSIYGPICLCGNLLTGALPKTEKDAVEAEKRNEDRVSYPRTCGNCQRVKRNAFRVQRFGPRPRWINYRKRNMEGTRQGNYQHQIFRQDVRKWIDRERLVREQDLRASGAEAPRPRL